MSLVASMMSANGRMAPADFQKAGLILIAISFVLALTPLVLPVVLASLLTIIVGLALIYPWACIWSKRLHDAGRSGWMFLVVLVIWIVLGLIVNQIVATIFGGEAARMMVAAMETGNPDAMMQASKAATQATALPSAVLNAIVGFGVIFAGNAILKQDPQENRYGPVPGAEGAPEAMPAESPVETPDDTNQN
ncbi:MAG: DUF805 domain-containing protein [Oceanicaulis sp.]|uniref:DUF805 domain-containing protein n=1 Tax=unclassified Oceanicaulis TaxID=2632123 RepID=UPI000066B0E9|nr:MULTISPECIES: DUF805 domain-containing protein [unclassified Oceanicaulis]EAP88905.1 lipoyltransferase [Oceanicaulis alexandrii HTCC2633] [Oceanicaulis sp. HTCC2633]MBC38336.1 DUF805 domain-containing protein [Oceanicaulis sp.]MBG36403.1 DUF805 domain-containing protein [Oceanicaulis sp.]